MSLIVQEVETGDYLLMTKGADTVMMPLMLQDQKCIKEVQNHMDEFATEGLRILVMGWRYLSEEEFNRWHEDWKDIQLSNLDNKDDLLNECAAKIEKNLELLGASGIEDKL